MNANLCTTRQGRCAPVTSKRNSVRACATQEPLLLRVARGEGGLLPSRTLCPSLSLMSVCMRLQASCKVNGCSYLQEEPRLCRCLSSRALIWCCVTCCWTTAHPPLTGMADAAFAHGCLHCTCIPTVCARTLRRQPERPGWPHVSVAAPLKPRCAANAHNAQLLT
jgi:hypothetical protein